MNKISNLPIVERFPFPLTEDTYRYSNSSQLLQSNRAVDITPEYIEEIRLKQTLLNDKTELFFQSLPHTREVQWEVFDMIINELCNFYPSYFSLQERTGKWLFKNDLLEEETEFIFGDEDSLGCEPLDFVGRNIQEDLVILKQRKDDLYIEAGSVCFPGNWSLPFNVGNTFLAIHDIVPTMKESGLSRKVRDFLCRIQTGQAWVRKNWTLNAGRVLETAPALFDQWGKYKNQITEENVGQLMHVRVEEQKFFRLPRSNNLLFVIHTHLISFDEFIENKQWAERLYQVILELPDELADYKGYLSIKDKIVNYLREKQLS